MDIEINEQPVRIACIIGKMWAGGVESVVFNYYRAINHSKFQFDFYYDEDSTVDPPKDLIDMGARFIMLPPYQHLIQYIHKLRNYLCKERYSIIHSHLNTLSIFPLYAAWREKIPIRIAHNHSVPGGTEYKRNALKVILKQFSRVFANEYCACSEVAGKWLFGDKLFKEGRITILKNAIDFSKFNVNEKTVIEKRRELGISANALVIGHVGRFTAAKNHQKVLSIFEAVRKQRPETVLLLIGDGEEHEKIIHRIHNNKMDNVVFLTGKVKNPELYYPMIHVLILPSVFEGVPVTVIESQIAGVPCVISDVVNKDVIISNACHYLNIKMPDESWAKEVLSIIGEKVVLSSSSSMYNINNAVKTLEEKYNHLLKSI